jgi:hypothetical protein
MELVTEPDIYAPNIDDKGNYIDYIPSFHNKKGLRCPCGTRKDKVYDTHSVFHSHVKTKTHQKWLSILNNNKTNYYVENIKLKETVHSQQQIIVRMENELKTKILTIDYLTNQLVQNNLPTIQKDQINLIHFD